MSVNFNPHLGFEPTGTVRSRQEARIKAREELHTNRLKTKPAADNSNSGEPLKNTYASAEIELLAAAAVIAKAKILKEQETAAIPVEIILSSLEATKSYNRAMATVIRVLNEADTIQNNFKYGEKISPEGQILREISDIDEDGIQTMKEYSPEGILSRETEFKDGIPQKAVEFNEDGTKNIINFRKGKVEEYSGNVKTIERGTKTDQYFTFENDSPVMYYEDYEQYDDDSSYAKAGISFKNERMAAYYAGIDCSENFLIDLHLRYDDDGNMYEYAETIETGTTMGKHLYLKDGKWTDISKK